MKKRIKIEILIDEDEMEVTFDLQTKNISGSKEEMTIEIVRSLLICIEQLEKKIPEDYDEQRKRKQQMQKDFLEEKGNRN